MLLYFRQPFPEAGIYWRKCKKTAESNPVFESYFTCVLVIFFVILRQFLCYYTGNLFGVSFLSDPIVWKNIFKNAVNSFNYDSKKLLCC